MLRFACLHCGARLQAPPGRAGVRATCPRCGRLTPVGGVPAAPEAFTRPPRGPSPAGCPPAWDAPDPRRPDPRPSGGRAPVRAWVAVGAVGALLLAVAGVAGVAALVGAGRTTAPAMSTGRMAASRSRIVGRWEGRLPDGKFGALTFYSDGIMEDSSEPILDQRSEYRFVDDEVVEITPAEVAAEVRAIGPLPKLRFRVRFPSDDVLVVDMGDRRIPLTRSR